ncbi:hypothetical protein PVAND_013794 [Polypedilum vanderplanki]|uniref:Cathepsin propeptide inhibitor domain-containing protein n=1 Tax=Polypedilum vanderplanki TaxID=319348 RepID=A0A9J6CQS8_POLVA|nr:hypothetical protein PVAND_013794 [Polypedilum vanderplanki]
MKVFLIFLLLISAVMTALVVPEPMWMEYKQTHNRKYGPSEDTERFETFKRRIQSINNHNERFDRGEVDHKRTIDQNTDRFSSELNN